MPIMDGYETVEKIREMSDNEEILLNNTKIIALSGYGEQEF